MNHFVANGKPSLRDLMVLTVYSGLALLKDWLLDYAPVRELNRRITLIMNDIPSKLRFPWVSNNWLSVNSILIPPCAEGMVLPANIYIQQG